MVTEDILLHWVLLLFPHYTYILLLYLTLKMLDFSTVWYWYFYIIKDQGLYKRPRIAVQIARTETCLKTLPVLLVKPNNFFIMITNTCMNNKVRILNAVWKMHIWLLRLYICQNDLSFITFASTFYLIIWVLFSKICSHWTCSH